MLISSARVNEVVSIEAEISRAMAEEERLGELISGPLRRVHDIRKRVTGHSQYLLNSACLYSF